MPTHKHNFLPDDALYKMSDKELRERVKQLSRDYDERNLPIQIWQAMMREKTTIGRILAARLTDDVSAVWKL